MHENYIADLAINGKEAHAHAHTCAGLHATSSSRKRGVPFRQNSRSLAGKTLSDRLAIVLLVLSPL